MRNSALYAALLVLSVGCARHVDPALSPYISRFVDESRRAGRIADAAGVSAELCDELTLGECRRRTFSAPTVRVNRNLWTMMNDAEREVVIFHELGHCALGREHENQRDTMSGIPTSVMNEAFLRADWYETNKARYITELFSK